MKSLGLVLALAMTACLSTASAKTKISKEDKKAIKSACKQENPGAGKSAISKCIKEKSKAKASGTESESQG